MKKFIFSLVLVSCGVFSLAQQTNTNGQAIHPFIAYEFGEAAFNKFQSISGEIGVRFPNSHSLRLVHMNVQLTEEHLSSSFAAAVDGPNVEGKFFGFELFYDFPILWEKLYISPSTGYYKSQYNHITLDEELENNTFTLGTALSFKERNIFGVRGLYYSVSIPFRISLNPIEETAWDETTIRNSRFDNNIWLFIGFEF